MERVRRQTESKAGFAKRGFTLVELLVVIAIVLLASLVAIPVFNSLSGRQVTDAARIFTGGLAGIRDSAIKYNEPRGIRLLPDPVLTLPPPGDVNAGKTQLVYNRFIPIEPAGDYSEGRLTVGPQYYSGGTPDATTFPPLYTTPDGLTYQFPFVESPAVSKVLMCEESPYAGGFASANGMPNSPTNWWWNARVGDKIKIVASGRSYTVVGPCVINPLGSGANFGNPEMFVNVGAPGTPSPLVRSYYPSPASVANAAALKPFATHRPEFLFLVDGIDDDTDGGYGHGGYIDEGFDGIQNNPPLPPVPPPGTKPPVPPPYTDTVIDDLSEWEVEQWGATATTASLQDMPTLTPLGSPSSEWVFANHQSATQDVTYIISRRPVPTQGGREVMLPAGMVIDATTWNSTQERSRIPIERGSLYCDIMVNTQGNYIQTQAYSTPALAPISPFLHFWLTDRRDVHPVGSLVDAAGNPILSTTASQPYLLPMGPDTPGYPARASDPILKGDRRLVTMFMGSGLVVTNTIETIPSANAYQPGEGFNVGDVGMPFRKAQLGLREAR